MESNTPIIRPTLVLLVLFTLLTGVVYPLAVWGVGQTIFPREANGSLIEVNGRVVGSELVAQSFTGPEWFWPRPSAVSYDASSSGGSNLATTNPALLAAVQDRIAALRSAESATSKDRVPVDLVTASGSGLDPDITPAAAHFQATRVALARGLDVGEVRRLIQDHIQGRTFGFLGEPRVNILKLNLALRNVQSHE
ncbi:potassium-transporting ATPase subunit KdpC [bacterium]|nr:potassium-transporting ATPase subunit KdpC [bacterium]